MDSGQSPLQKIGFVTNFGILLQVCNGFVTLRNPLKHCLFPLFPLLCYKVTKIFGILFRRREGREAPKAKKCENVIKTSFGVDTSACRVKLAKEMPCQRGHLVAGGGKERAPLPSRVVALNQIEET